jgi:hypothetical protein
MDGWNGGVEGGGEGERDGVPIGEARTPIFEGDFDESKTPSVWRLDERERVAGVTRSGWHVQKEGAKREMDGEVRREDGEECDKGIERDATRGYIRFWHGAGTKRGMFRQGCGGGMNEGASERAKLEGWRKEEVEGGREGWKRGKRGGREGGMEGGRVR